VRIQLYRIAQEALSNIARHSGATQAFVEWIVDGPQRATLRIADNGKGFDTAGPLAAGHFGLDNMRSRAGEIGAAFSLVSAPGQGTEVRVELADAR
jgi:signal transduction histidine kinase